MDIKVITRHAPVNYGSLLQAMATVEVIERMGHQCEIIDYQRHDESGLKAVMIQLKAKPSWHNNPLKRLVYIAMRYPEEKWGEIQFAKLRLKHLKMTERYSTIEELKQVKADVMMTGSDQVWGPVLNGRPDEAYFLTFVPKGTRKVAYAASFGKTFFEDKTLQNYKKMLGGYDMITVREDKAVELLDSWGIRNDGQVLDPTLLLDSGYWGKYATKEVRQRYVLIYEIHNNPSLDEYAKRFSKHVGLPLVRLTPSFHQISRGGKMKYMPSICEFMSYFKNCEYLVTDSFHGTAFGLNFNRNIIEVMPNNATGSRNMSILNLTGLTGRVVKDLNDYSIANDPIDYDSVNRILTEERTKSLEKLKKLLKLNDEI